MHAISRLLYGWDLYGRFQALSFSGLMYRFTDAKGNVSKAEMRQYLREESCKSTEVVTEKTPDTGSTSMLGGLSYILLTIGILLIPISGVLALLINLVVGLEKGFWLFFLFNWVYPISGIILALGSYFIAVFKVAEAKEKRLLKENSNQRTIVEYSAGDRPTNIGICLSVLVGLGIGSFIVYACLLSDGFIR